MLKELQHKHDEQLILIICAGDATNKKGGQINTQPAVTMAEGLIKRCQLEITACAQTSPSAGGLFHFITFITAANTVYYLL